MFAKSIDGLSKSRNRSAISTLAVFAFKDSIGTGMYTLLNSIASDAATIFSGIEVSAIPNELRRSAVTYVLN